MARLSWKHCTCSNCSPLSCNLDLVLPWLFTKFIVHPGHEWFCTVFVSLIWLPLQASSVLSLAWPRIQVLRRAEQRRREKECLVSTACACVTSGGISPPPVPFVYVRVTISIFITWLAASATFDEALSFAIQRLSSPSLCWTLIQCSSRYDSGRTTYKDNIPLQCTWNTTSL